MTQCSVSGCDSKRVMKIADGGMKFHCFPNPLKERDRFRAYVEACGNASLFKSPPSLFTKARICHKHFALPHPLMTSLPRDAIPQLYLPDPIPIPPGWLDMIEPPNTKIVSPIQSTISSLTHCEKMDYETTSKIRPSPSKKPDSSKKTSVGIPDNILYNMLSKKSAQQSKDAQTNIKNNQQVLKSQPDQATVPVTKPQTVTSYTESKKAPKSYSKYFFCNKTLAKNLMKNIQSALRVAPDASLLTEQSENNEADTMVEEFDSQDEGSTENEEDDERLRTYCRICAKECTDMKNIFEAYNNDILQMLKICTDLEFSKTDRLPKQMCQACIAEVTACHQFKLKSNKSDIYLRELFLDTSNINNEDINLQEENDENELKCKTCGMVCKTYVGLEKHTLKCEEVSCNFCVICNKKIQYSMPKHMLVHKGQRPYKCLQCGRSYTSKRKLIGHQNVHHKTGTIQKKCVDSNKELALHRKVHKLKKHTYLCSICGAKFATSKYFQIHNRKHRGDKDIECTSCDRKFYTYSQLATHNRYCKSTSNEEPSICFVCGEICINQSALEEHFLIHSDQKLYNCDKCDEAFSRKKEYITHVKTHTGQFECFLCDKSFHESSLLGTHHFRVHKFCETCGKTFTNFAHLRRHKFSIHSGTDFEKAGLT